MTTVSTPIGATGREGRDTAQWWESRQVWGGLSIITMWMAVLVVGAFGPDITATSNNASTNTSSTTVPSVVVVALCALVATMAVARASFAHRA
jgi:hypothetical protein